MGWHGPGARRGVQAAAGSQRKRRPHANKRRGACHAGVLGSALKAHCCNAGPLQRPQQHAAPPACCEPRPAGPPARGWSCRSAAGCHQRPLHSGGTASSSTIALRPRSKGARARVAQLSSSTLHVPAQSRRSCTTPLHHSAAMTTNSCAAAAHQRRHRPPHRRKRGRASHRPG